MTFSIVTTLLGKLGSLVSQVVLGWMLTKSDFGLYAAATSCVSLASAIRDGGSGKFLVQQGAELPRFAHSVRRIAWAFNFLVAAILLVFGRFKSGDEGYLGVQNLVILISISIIVASPSVLGRAMASCCLEFKSIARITSVTIFIRYVSMITFAVLGFGVYSFAIPLVLVGIAEAVGYERLYRKLSSALETTEGLDQASYVEVLSSTKWIMFGAVAIALINTGDYLILGSYLQPEDLGVYFFGYQLSIAVSSVFTSSMQQVLLPVFGKLQHNRSQQLGEAVQSSLESLFALSGPICVAAALLSPAMILVVWGDKWSQSIPVCQAMLLSLSIRLSTPVSRAAVESLGLWRMQSALLWVDAIGISFVCISCLVLNVTSVTKIAVAVSSYRMLMGAFQLAICCRKTGVNLSQTVAILVPALASLSLFFVLQFLATTWLTSYSAKARSVVSTICFLVLIQSLLLISKPYQKVMLLILRKIQQIYLPNFDR